MMMLLQRCSTSRSCSSDRSSDGRKRGMLVTSASSMAPRSTDGTSTARLPSSEARLRPLGLAASSCLSRCLGRAACAQEERRDGICELLDGLVVVSVGERALGGHALEASHVLLEAPDQLERCTSMSCRALDCASSPAAERDEPRSRESRLAHVALSTQIVQLLHWRNSLSAFARRATTSALEGTGLKVHRLVIIGAVSRAAAATLQLVVRGEVCRWRRSEGRRPRRSSARLARPPKINGKSKTRMRSRVDACGTAA